MTFGRYLLRNQIVSEQQLRDATATMVLFGGRMGTHLVELGAVGTEELERHLAAHLGVLAAASEQLEKPSIEALTALPHDLVRRHKVFPFALEAGCLEVAMRDPSDHGLCRELADASRLRIAPLLTSEIRLFFLLEKHFGVERNERYALLGWTSPGPNTPVLWLDDVIEEADEQDGWKPLAAGEELIDATSFAALYEHGKETPGCASPDRQPDEATRPVRRSSVVAGEDSVAALESGLEQARDRDAVVSHALALALRHAPAVALFAVRGTAQGLAAAGAVACTDLRDVLVAPEAGSLLARAIDRGEAAVGAPGPGSVDARLARLLRPFEPSELAFFPVRIDGRVVNLLYADNGCEPLGEASCAALTELCERAAHSYERIILERKRRLC